MRPSNGRDIDGVEQAFERRPAQQGRNPVQSDNAFDHGPGQIGDRIILARPTLHRDRFCSFEQDAVTSYCVAGRFVRRSLKSAWKAIPFSLLATVETCCEGNGSRTVYIIGRHAEAESGIV